jgi:hypothetical protein
MFLNCYGYQRITVDMTSSINTLATAFALLVSAAETKRFAPTTWPHDHALFDLCELARHGQLAVDTRSWRFVPSADGGRALVGLSNLLLTLSEEGWLERDHAEATYVVSSDLYEWGSRELAALSPAERERVLQVARRWKARASTSSKKTA